MSKNKQVVQQKAVSPQDFQERMKKVKDFIKDKDYHQAVSSIETFMKDQEDKNYEFSNEQYSEMLQLRADCNFQRSQYIETLDDLDKLTNLNDEKLVKSISSEYHYRSRQIFMKYNNDI